MMKLARIRHRFMATMVDVLVIFVIIAILFSSNIPFIIGAFVSPNQQIEAKIIFEAFRWGVIVMIILVIYNVAIPYYYKGQTLGKKLFKLKVVCEDDSEVDLKQLFLREVIGKIFVDFLSLGVTIISSYVIMLLREDKKSLSDIIAKTKVIDLYIEEE